MSPQGYPLVAITGIGTENERAWLVVGWTRPDDWPESQEGHAWVVPVGTETTNTVASRLNANNVVWQVLGSK